MRNADAVEGCMIPAKKECTVWRKKYICVRIAWNPAMGNELQQVQAALK